MSAKEKSSRLRLRNPKSSGSSEGRSLVSDGMEGRRK